MNDKSIRVCAGIVTYNPDIELLKRNIESIYFQVQKVMLFDNGSENVDAIRCLVDTYENITIITESCNRGIAYALNQLCEWAIRNEFAWILTLDQDSISPDKLVDKLSDYVREDVAIVAPNIVYKNNEKYAIHSEKKEEEVAWVITSASLTNLKIWKLLDGFDEWLFIDGVDYDYGIRANKAGYKIIRTYGIELLHELGQLKCVSVLGKTIYVTNHSAFRRYYMSRNAIYLKKKLHTGKTVSVIVKYIIKVMAFEDNKMEKMISIIHGVSDGMKSIPGETVRKLV